MNIDTNKKPTLNLNKNDVLNLSKVSNTLESIKVSAGWDVNKSLFGASYDLDLCAILLNKENKLISSANPCVYFGKKSSNGISLDGDNLTGEGDGDDENIFVELSKLPYDVATIKFCVVIYSANMKRQSFDKVKNAYVRLSKMENRREVEELCRYNLSEDGGSNTAVIFAELYKASDNTWNFKAIGEYIKASIDSLKNSYK